VFYRNIDLGRKNQETHAHFSMENLNLKLAGKNNYKETGRNLAFRKVLVETMRSVLPGLHFRLTRGTP
jgi:hypothetical protein